jgi:hypothetical protein
MEDWILKKLRGCFSFLHDGIVVLHLLFLNHYT